MTGYRPVVVRLTSPEAAALEVAGSRAVRDVNPDALEAGDLLAELSGAVAKVKAARRAADVAAGILPPPTCGACGAPAGADGMCDACRGELDRLARSHGRPSRDVARDTSRRSPSDDGAPWPPAGGDVRRSGELDYGARG